MAWIEAHQELRNHPKTKKAARLLGISRPQMIGHLFLCAGGAWTTQRMATWQPLITPT